MDDRYKFRAWNKEDKEFFTWEMIIKHLKLSDLESDKFVFQQCTGLKDKNGKLIYEDDILSLDGNMSADNSMGILPNGWTFDESSKYQVIYNTKLGAFELDTSKEDFSEIEKEFGDYTPAYINKFKNHVRNYLLNGEAKIIGNIHENSDLLK